jgi:cytochrome c peroxidase
LDQQVTSASGQNLRTREIRKSQNHQRAKNGAVWIFVLLSILLSAENAQANAAAVQPLSKKAEWGRALFFEPRLSANGKVSCATCHETARAFTENKATSSDIEGHSVGRNSPTLINAAHMDVLTWANPVLRKLENQIIVPLFLDTPGEMALIRVWPKVRAELLEKSPHIEMFRAAFPEEKGSPDTRHLFSALAEFVRTLEAFDSPYDQFLAGNTNALSPKAKRGRDLFISKRTNCASCHSGVLLSNASKKEFLTSKDPLAPPAVRDEHGNILQFAHNGLYNWDGRGGVPEKHEGLYEFSLKLEDRGKFRIPPLRNVARTPPYMHDGSIATLEDVVKHYNRGGTHRCEKKKSCGPAPQKHALIRPLALTAADQEALVEFLRSLSTKKY